MANSLILNGAGEEARTLDPNLGKTMPYVLALYPMLLSVTLQYPLWAFQGSGLSPPLPSVTFMNYTITIQSIKACLFSSKVLWGIPPGLILTYHCHAINQ
jgi:hypothetical protein